MRRFLAVGYRRPICNFIGMVVVKVFKPIAME